MPRIFITPDDDSYDVNNPTFLVYDSDSKALVHTCPKLPELDSTEMAGQGRPTFRPFGIASDDTHIYVVSHNRLGRFNRQTYAFEGLVSLPLFINTHEMVVHNRVLYAANTSNNTIGVYDLTTGENKFFDVCSLKFTRTAPAPEHVGSHDTAHVNSLCVADGKIFFSLHHLDKCASQLGYFSIADGSAKIVAEAGRCTHGVQVLDGTLYSLSTGTGEIVEVDLATGLTALYKVVDPSKTFLRGLDVLDGQIVFGGSNTYSESRTIYMNNCFVARFDSSTKKAALLLNVDSAYIISDMKVLD